MKKVSKLKLMLYILNRKKMSVPKVYLEFFKKRSPFCRKEELNVRLISDIRSSFRLQKTTTLITS